MAPTRLIVASLCHSQPERVEQLYSMSHEYVQGFVVICIVMVVLLLSGPSLLSNHFQYDSSAQVPNIPNI